jgi:hypothetical protein
MTELFFNGITGVFSAPSDIISFLMPGKAAHPSQASKLSKTQRAARCNQILRPLTLWVSQLHTLKIGILAAAGFVTFPVNHKNTQLVETLPQADRNNRPTEVSTIL